MKDVPDCVEFGNRGTQIMTELGNTSARWTATDTLAAPAGTTNASKETILADGRAIRLIRRLLVINLGLVALQAISAGLFLSGYGHALRVHAYVALALQFGVLVQAVTAIVLWRRRRVPAWLAGLSIGLFVMMFLQVGFGYQKRYWLHVPIGVGIFGWLTRQLTRLDTRWPPAGARS